MGRQYEADARSFLRSLAELLESALPGEAVVRRAGLLGGDKRPIRHVAVLAARSNGASLEYAIEDPGQGPLTATKTQTVHGIKLKTETIAVDVWIEEVGRALSERAAATQSIRNALSALT